MKADILLQTGSVREREFSFNTQDMCTTLMEGTNDSFAFLKFGLQLSEE